MLVFVRMASQEGNDIGSQTGLSYEEFGPKNGLENENNVNNYMPPFPSIEEEDERENENVCPIQKRRKKTSKNLD